MKISYKVSNLRKIEYTPFIDVRPLTILVGKNSSGKSSFLRSFPLLRQSIETKASAPVLWWGDYVDFGDFKTAVRDGDDKRSISFSFRAEDFRSPASLEGRYVSRTRRAAMLSEVIGWVELLHEIGAAKETTTRKKISISTSSSKDDLVLIFKSDLAFPIIKIGGVDLKEIIPNIEVYISAESLFEVPFFLKRTRDGKSRELVGWSGHQAFHDRLKDLLRKNVAKTVSELTISLESRKILQISELQDHHIDDLSAGSIKAIKKFYSSIYGRLDAGIGLEIKTICKAYHLLHVFEALTVSLRAYYSNVEYIGPARARSERFYRQQELQFSDISPDGRNLPMFLASLSDSDQAEFSDWVMEKFGYGVALNRDGSHISINLVKGEESVNVVDTGYGVSQVLPILAQIWWMGHDSRYIRRSKVNAEFMPILAIEQPELHLHPAHQSLLADVFSDVICRSGRHSKPISLIIETHSEYLINKIGALIYDKKIDAADVQIVVFGEDEGGGVMLSTYDSEGVLDNWPHGFFSY